MKNSTILSVVRISLMTVIIILCSWISLPFLVPFTLQTLGIFMTLFLIGGKDGLISVLLYILLGMVGLPVFSGFSSGIGHLISPLGGYIWGFVLCALFYMLTEKLANKNRLIKTLISAAGTLLCYASGILWYMISSGTSQTPWQLICICILPYIIPDTAKILLAVFLTEKIKPILQKTTKE